VGRDPRQDRGHVAEHRTTLVFVNTRRLAERLAHLLAERVGEDRVAAHHGSLSKDRRLKLEARLRAGDLKVLVATASLELGIDIGPVELVCQIGSPRSLATFLQRVGRSGHARGATPKGRLYPTTRDELVESAALLRGVRAGRLDRVLPPVAPLDILAQQIVAACASEAWSEDDLYALARRAAPFADLARADFDAVVEMLAEGIQTGRGRRGAWLHRDLVNGVLRGRRGARIVAVTSGGAIPETADYKVVADPDDTVVGTVNEDWAIESMAGDTFLLGSTSWRIRRVEAGVVRVVDAQGAPPSVPFWLGEAPARTAELSAEVGDLRARVGAFLARTTRRARWRGSSASAASEASPPRRSSAIWARRSSPSACSRPRGPGLRALLRRGGRDAARDPLAVRGPDQSRPRLGIAQALLPPLRLRAAGGGERRRRGALARAGPEPAARGRAALSSRRGRRRRRSPRRCCSRRCSRCGGAGTSAARSWSCASAAAGAIRRPSSAWRPTT
jgi:ATP-dependent Lhr-like helicase